MADELTAEGELASAFLAEVGSRIRERRRAQGLTVQQLADAAAMSRRLLTQIEHGQANPSLVAVTRLSRSLGTDFTDLLPRRREADGPIEVVGPDDATLVWSSARGSTAHLLVSTVSARAADLWRWRLEPGDTYQAQADPPRSQELLAVLDGVLTIVADGAEVSVPPGSSARLRSDRAYSYRNDGDGVVVFLRTVALAG